MEKDLIYPVFSSRHGIGLTFLCWSYHWLSGHDDHWHWKFGLSKLPQNPNTGVNAHFFKKNYCDGYERWQSFMNNDNNNKENCSLYGGPLNDGDIQEISQDYSKCLQFASQRARLIFCVENPQDQWYFLHRRAINPTGDFMLTSNEITCFQNFATIDFLKTYFKSSLEKFDQNLWDIRESIAVNYKYLLQDRSYLQSIDPSTNYLYIDSRDLWYNGENCLHRIFDYLGKRILTERIEHWKKMYNQWQLTQMKLLQFNWYLPTVVDSIVNNRDFNLDFLQLSLIQEGVIQGHLITEHNLNLKNWNLVKFPSNTKDLHQLLEENIHH